MIDTTPVKPQQGTEVTQLGIAFPGEGPKQQGVDLTPQAQETESKVSRLSDRLRRVATAYVRAHTAPFRLAATAIRSKEQKTKSLNKAFVEASAAYISRGTVLEAFKENVVFAPSGDLKSAACNWARALREKASSTIPSAGRATRMRFFIREINGLVQGAKPEHKDVLRTNAKKTECSTLQHCYY